MSPDGVQNEDDERHSDVLKGFAYFKTFGELQSWSEETADPLQRSNTPLVRRAREKGRDQGAKVMLVHDYAGGYNDYESIQGSDEPREQYSCEYLQNVEVFVYFSHRLVSVPPPAWMNTCHRNGVKALGTFIVEPGSPRVDCILEQDEFGSYWVARKLARMAKHFGFDGWLINIEATFSFFSWGAAKLEGFLRQLRAELGQDSQVVWYDALTWFNFIWYQNTLNDLNLPFALAAGSILTNYAWTPELALTGRDRAIESGLGLDNIYFGIDVYAQNSQHGSKHKRKTWPKTIGGGTGTDLGVQVLQKLGLNTGIFAPGWSFEHFSEHSRAVEKAIWQGTALPRGLLCECDPDRPHDLAPSELDHGVSRYTDTFPAGSEAFFHTNFETAFSRAEDGIFRAHLGSQQILPVVSPPSYPTPALRAELQDSPSRCSILTNYNCDTQQHNHQLRLAKVRLSTADLLRLRMTYHVPKRHSGNLWLQINLVDEHGRSSFAQHQLSNEGLVAALDWNLAQPLVDAQNSAGTRVVSWIDGIYISYRCKDGSEIQTREAALLDIYSITILPQSVVTPSCEILNVGLEKRGTGRSEHYRLVWTLDAAEPDANGNCLPYSHITGPCAYFTVQLDGKSVGRAYALEFVLSKEIDSDATLEVKIVGIGFDDKVLCYVTTVLVGSGISEENWVLLD